MRQHADRDISTFVGNAKLVGRKRIQTIRCGNNAKVRKVECAKATVLQARLMKAREKDGLK